MERILSPPEITKRVQYEVLAPGSATTLGSLLDINANFSSIPALSPLRYAMRADGDDFLGMEEKLISSDPSLQNANNLPELQDRLDNGLRPLVLVDERTAADLVPRLRKWCSSVDNKGLARTIRVLYPIRKSTTEHNIRNTISSKLLDPGCFPLTSLSILDNPLQLRGRGREPYWARTFPETRPPHL